jgi:type I restriction enzyme S subunit
MSWPKACLGDVAQVVSGATPKSSVDHYWDGDIPWITPADLSRIEGKEVTATSRLLTEAGLSSCSSRLLPPRSVLFSSRAPIGHVAINTVPMATNQGFKSFIPNQEILSSDYLYWWLKSNKLYLQSLGRGATFKEVSKEIVESIEIPLPPLEEQRRIAAILDKVALLIQSAAHAFFLSQELKKSLVHETLGLAREGDERVRIKVSEVADMITGFPFKSAQYTDKAQHTRLCRGINVLPDRIEWKQVARWPEITPELRSYQIDEDDILIAMDRPWITEGFKIARVKPIDIPTLLVQRVARIRAGYQILPRILFEVLSSKAFATHCTPTETTVPHISPIEIREYEFELPCLKEQKRIDSILAGIEKSQAAMNQRANLLKEKLCTLSRSYFN